MKPDLSAMEVCILQPLNCILQQIIVQIRSSAEEDGTGMRFEPPSVLAWRSHLSAQEYQEARNSRHVCSLPQLFTACLSSKMSSLNPAWAAEEGAALRRSRLLIEQLLVPGSAISLPFRRSRWPADCLQPSGCQENCDKANVRSCGAFWMFLTPSICFPAWAWQRSCVGLIGCLSSPGSG